MYDGSMTEQMSYRTTIVDDGHKQVLAMPQPEYKGPQANYTQDGHIYVDEGIHDLLQKLWEAGFLTQFSCQGGPGPAYIMFANVDAACDFVTRTIYIAHPHVPALFLEVMPGIDDSCHQVGTPYRARARVSWHPPRNTQIIKEAWGVS